jgi:hypothetical protein
MHYRHTGFESRAETVTFTKAFGPLGKILHEKEIAPYKESRTFSYTFLLNQLLVSRTRNTSGEYGKMNSELVLKSEARGHLGITGVDMRIILKWMQGILCEEFGWMVLARIQQRSFVKTVISIWKCTKCVKFLD